MDVQDGGSRRSIEKLAELPKGKLTLLHFFIYEMPMNEVVMVKLVEMKGEGGMIGVDAAGNVSMLFNSAGMYRAMQNSNGDRRIGIYKD